MDSSNSDEDKTPPRKQIKRKHYDQKYNSQWEKTEKWIKISKKGDKYFYCIACNSDLKCGSGSFNVKKHSTSLKHVDNVKAISQQTSVSTIFPQSTSKSFNDKVKSGEMQIACFLAKHNLAFNIAGGLKNLIQTVASDSEIAKKLALERTKAHEIVTNVTGIVSKNKLIETLKTEKFSLIVDESTDRSTIKHLALIVRSAKNFDIKDDFLGLIPIVDGTATALHSACVNFMQKENIPFKDNMIGFAADGTNSMFGQFHSLSTHFAKDIPHIFLMKCVCHSFHLCASYACKALPREVEDFARDVYNHLKNSSKRLADYKEFQLYLDIKPNRLLHPSQTRWLSLLPVVQRLLEQLSALKLYFQGIVLNDGIQSARQILDRCLNPTLELYLEYLKFVLPYFHNLNKEMQSEQPKLFILYEQIFSTYKTILECFIKSDYLELSETEKFNIPSQDHASYLEQKILNVDYESSEHHLPNNEVYLGGNVEALLGCSNFISKIEKVDIENFRKNCLQFYVQGAKQIRKRFAFEDEERQKLKSLSFLNPTLLITSRSVKSIAHLGRLFPGFCPKDITELDREWRLLRNTSLPYNSSDENIDIGNFWRQVSLIKKGDGSEMFPLVTEMVNKFLVLPHSSANVERLFSAINLMKTDQRNRLNTETLEGLLHTKRFIKDTGCQPTKEHFDLYNKNMYKYKRAE